MIKIKEKIQEKGEDIKYSHLTWSGEKLQYKGGDADLIFNNPEMKNRDWEQGARLQQSTGWGLGIQITEKVVWENGEGLA